MSSTSHAQTQSTDPTCWPFVVEIETFDTMSSTWQHAATGVVIDDDLILTSAQFGMTPSTTRIVTLDASCAKSFHAVAFNVDHPEFMDDPAQCYPNGVRGIGLASSLTFGPSLQPVPLATSGFAAGNAVMISADGVCLEATTAMIGGNACTGSPGVRFDFDNADGSSACHGEQGSPIVVDVGGGDYELVGIASWGTGGNACGGGAGVGQDIFEVRDWILNNFGPAPAGTLNVPASCLPVDPCPTAGTPTPASFVIVGTGTGTPWEWAICSPTSAFPDVLGGTSETGTAMDMAIAFAASINAAGCASITASAAPSILPGSATLNIDVDDDFDLKVRPVGDPNWCTVTTLGACNFNPTIQQILLSGFDCQNNGQDDLIDILTGVSVDVNVNAIPDECEGLTPDAPLGIEVTALGQAIIGTTIEGFMTVSNIDASGLNGFDVHLGEAEGWEGTFRGPMTAAQLPTGLVLEDEVIGTIDGTPDQTVMTMRVDDVGAMLEVSFDPGATYTINVYDGETLAASIPGQTGPAYRIPATSERFDGGYYCWIDDDNVRHCYHVNSSGQPIEIVSSGQVVNGDRVVLAAENPKGTVDSLRRVRRRMRRDDQGVEICERMAMQQFDNEHVASGVSIEGVTHPSVPETLALAVNPGRGGGMVTGNISINNGSVLSTSSIDIETTVIDLGTVDQRLRLDARGTVDGTWGQSLGTASLRSLGPAVEVSADFTALGTASATVAVYDQGTFIGSTSVPTADALGTLSAVSGNPVTCNCLGKLGGQTPCFFYKAPELIAWTAVSGPLAGTATLVGDEIRILADGAAVTVDSVDGITIGAEALTGFTILNEEFNANCPADLDGSGEVGFADLTALLNAWGPCGGASCDADLDGSGDVGFADLTTLLNAWGPCV